MRQKKTNPAEAARLLALLWESQTSEGRSNLTVKAIVSAAIAIADAEGLNALSMRKVAERLEAGTMSLYTYIPGKRELIDLMVDTAYGQLYASVDAPRQHSADWRTALRFVAEQNWALYRRHPWLLDVPPGRPVLGPHATFKYEVELRPLDHLGLTDVEMDATLTLLLTHVAGCARAQLAVEQTQQTTGMTDAEWWVTQGPLLAKIVDPAHFPVAMRVGTASSQEYQAASDPAYLFTFGLECILAGISELLRSRPPR